MGLSEGDEVSDGPGDDITVTGEVALAAFVRAEDTGNVPCDGGLFGQDRNRTGIVCFHHWFQYGILGIVHACRVSGMMLVN